MALETLIDARHEHRDQAMVSINPKLQRIVIYKAAREMMIQKYGEEFEAVLIQMDGKNKIAFWLKPCRREERGSRQLNTTSATTRTLSCRLLLQRLEWKGTKTERFHIAWDEKNEAARVDLSKSE